MADPVTKILGPLNFTKTLIDPSDASLSATDKEELFKLSTIDCAPPPKATTEYVKPRRFVPKVQPRSLQQSEKTHLKNIRTLFGLRPNSLTAVQTMIETLLDFDAMVISYKSKKLQAMYEKVDCFTKDIYLRVRYNIYEIKVSARRAVTLGNDQFPAGDEIATYRIREVKDYRFESHLTFNKKCCEREPAETPNRESTEYYTALNEKLIEEIIVTGKRLKKAEIAPPPPILPGDEEWDLGIKGGYYKLDQWELDLDLEWKKVLEDD